MKHKEIKMIAGPFAGYNYQRYDGLKTTQKHSTICVELELIPGDYYRGIPGITSTMMHMPGCMPASFLEKNPTLWTPIE